MKKLWMAGLAGVAVLALGSGLVFGESEQGERGEAGEGRWFGWQPAADIRPVSNATYEAECSACHFAYQPGLLPARSWESLMGKLADHFGENAELDQTTRLEITKYLVDNAADRVDYGRSRSFAASVPADQAPLRITETRYFQRKHHEVDSRFVKNNPKVGSFSNCIACHTGAKQGVFNEHEVNIPGVGRWDD